MSDDQTAAMRGSLLAPLVEVAVQLAISYVDVRRAPGDYQAGEAHRLSMAGRALRIAELLLAGELDPSAELHQALLVANPPEPEAAPAPPPPGEPNAWPTGPMVRSA